MSTARFMQGAIVVSQRKGGQYKIEPLGLTYEVMDTSPLYTQLMKDFGFQGYIDSTLQEQVTPEELASQYGSEIQERLRLLKEDIKDGKVKITIDFKVEKYIE